MLETKQLKYFVVSADCESFSEASKVLYTTQSNVSKVIAGLEKQLGYQLFQREKNGITLTSRGASFYNHASALVSQLEELEAESVDNKKGVVKISINPSSWFARHFSDYYAKNAKSGICYNIHTDTTENIVQRLRKMEDEVGFIYVFPERKLQFEYALKSYQLEFEKLGSVSGMLYFDIEDDYPFKRPDMEKILSSNLVQGEHDEYMECSNWTLNGKLLSDYPLEVAVTTNSDYIMNIMIKNNGLGNITSETFTAYEEGKGPGIKLKKRDGDITYGIIYNKNETMSKEAKKIVAYIRDIINS
ncbi:DNA-binding transcriptional regulator, LysR family [Acetitomaculum ruminis DSM 5522]|uniref:DNA-binding transcriptional regulator, LysR family n=1 Tax=Acetitomaculum ruminis DSM 5522 TaxID=1120918 RepID=A0A1I0XX81_9FIRM|nr:LysR family transcriptional regulator [Acetitomaculum ruminis]SFB05665.1 DNA-binding transcriptional regulator, LysR family [Acetitomaculum ruminis DSM 5522]